MTNCQHLVLQLTRAKFLQYSNSECWSGSVYPSGLKLLITDLEFQLVFCIGCLLFYSETFCFISSQQLNCLCWTLLLYCTEVKVHMRVCWAVPRGVWGPGRSSLCGRLLKICTRERESKPLKCKFNITGAKLYIYGIVYSYLCSGIAMTLMYFNLPYITFFNS
jgi:hypothetical protein